ncbi:MAG: TlpA family protein disulfide reductase [Sphingomonadales bacterium]|nr:TlpA family protein disulfide reductase [Sphingomonadales bacterium]
MIAEGPPSNLPPHILLPIWALEPLLPLSRSLTVAILGSALLIGGCDRQSGSAAQPQASTEAATKSLDGVIDRSHKGSQLPEFLLKDSAGKELRLSSLKGKPVLINLWATWCAPCVAELPALNRLAAKRSGDLRIVTVSQDLAQPEKVAAFLKDKAPLLEPWLDPNNDLTTFYETTTLPTSIFYDARGREVWRYVGPRYWDNDKAAALLAEPGQPA